MTSITLTVVYDAMNARRLELLDIKPGIRPRILKDNVIALLGLDKALPAAGRRPPGRGRRARAGHRW